MKTFYSGGFFYNADKEEILLHKRDDKTTKHPKKWAFFGGSSEENETPIETFIREIHEELGVLLQREEVIPLCDYLNPEFGTHRNIFYALRHTKKQEMTLGEGADFDWIPLTLVSNYDLTPLTLKDITYFVTLNKHED